MRSLVKKEMIIAGSKQVLFQGERLKERKTGQTDGKEQWRRHYWSVLVMCDLLPAYVALYFVSLEKLQFSNLSNSGN